MHTLRPSRPQSLARPVNRPGAHKSLYLFWRDSRDRLTLFLRYLNANSPLRRVPLYPAIWEPRISNKRMRLSVNGRAPKRAAKRAIYRLPVVSAALSELLASSVEARRWQIFEFLSVSPVC